MRIIETIKRYKDLEKEFSQALNKAGGAAEIIVNDDAWVQVLSQLAANNIKITADYCGQTR